MFDATQLDKRKWFEYGDTDKYTHMFIVCDTVDWDEYPVYVVDNVKSHYKQLHSINRQIIIEVYLYSIFIDDQLNQGKCKHCYRDLFYHGYYNSCCPGSHLTIYNQLSKFVCWNPYSKVVQDYKDGTIYEEATNCVRSFLKLSIPWQSKFKDQEINESPIHFDEIVFGYERNKH